MNKSVKESSRRVTLGSAPPELIWGSSMDLLDADRSA